MEATDAFWENTKLHQYGSADSAPPSLLTCLYALIGDEKVVVSHLVRAEGDDRSVWRGVWVTESHIAYIRGRYSGVAGEDEDEFAHSWGIEQPSGWVRKLNDIAGIDLAGATGGLKKRHDGGARYVEPDITVHFSDQTKLNLPLPRTKLTRPDRDSLDKLIQVVRSKFVGQASA